MSVFIDTGLLLAAARPADRLHDRARTLLAAAASEGPFTTDHVAIEAWSILRKRGGYPAAMRFLRALRETPLAIEAVTRADFERAQSIAQSWADQEFDLVDCTSFAVMERAGCRRAATFDRDFSVYRFGADRNKAFEILP